MLEKVSKPVPHTIGHDLEQARAMERSTDMTALVGELNQMEGVQSVELKL